MPVGNKELIKIIHNAILSSKDGMAAESSDYCPNGLQVEGTPSIKKIITGVTASLELINKAIEMSADAIIVHHGYFWKNEDSVITGMKKDRIKSLLENDINLYAYHLPLDTHPVLGNNAQLATALGITKNVKPLCLSNSSISPNGIVYEGELEDPLGFDTFAAFLEEKLKHKPLGIVGNNKQVKKLSWCTGAGQGFITKAFEAGVDTFLSGEISEQTVHQARELGVNYFSCGHHATERYGIKALAGYLQEKLPQDVDVTFIDLYIPV